MAVGEDRGEGETKREAAPCKQRWTMGGAVWGTGMGVSRERGVGAMRGRTIAAAEKNRAGQESRADSRQQQQTQSLSLELHAGRARLSRDYYGGRDRRRLLRERFDARRRWC